MLLKSEDSHVIVQSPDTGHVLNTSVKSVKQEVLQPATTLYAIYRYLAEWSFYQHCVHLSYSYQLSDSVCYRHRNRGCTQYV